MRKFLVDPEYIWARVLAVTVLIVAGGLFVSSNSHRNPLGGQGLVYGEAGAGKFGIGTMFTTNPVSAPNTDRIATADFNSDGNTDVVITDSSNNSINVYFGNGSGGYAFAGNVVAGVILKGITAGDYNEDGDVDIALSSTDNNVYTYLGNGAGGFTTLMAFPMFFAGGGGISTGDVDEDGNLDLLVSLVARGGVQIYYGSGTGLFTSDTLPTSLFITGAIGGSAVGDYDEDGHLDIIVAGATAAMEVWTGDGTGNFVHATSILTMDVNDQNLATGDFNNDDNLDMAYVRLATSRIEVFYGDGDGGFSGVFTTPIYDDASLLGLASGDMDMNGDGLMDLVATTGSNNFVTFLNPPALIPINVSASNPDGTYGTGAHILIQIQLNNAATVVTSGGTPQLTIGGNGAEPTAVVPYSSGSGTDTLVFDFTVPAGFTAADLDYETTLSLDLNGAVIKDTATGLISLAPTLFDPGLAGSLGFNKNIVIDTTAPVLAEVTPVPPTGTDTTPDYTFSSTEAGTISYGGSCASATSSASSGSNTITLSTLADGTYSDCTVTVTDTLGNASAPLSMTPFTIATVSGTTGGTTTGGGGGTGGTSGGGTSGGNIVLSPVLREVTPVRTPSAIPNPTYVFSSNESGSLTYRGACTSTTSLAVNGLNSITFSPLPNGSYSNCTIQETDLAGRTSNILAVSPFVISVPVVIPSTEEVPKPTQPPVQPPVTTVPKEPLPVTEEPPVIEVPAPIEQEPLPTPPQQEVVVESPAPKPAVKSIFECSPGTATGTLGMIAGEAWYRLCSLVPVLSGAHADLKDAYDSVHADIVLKVVATLAVLSAALSLFMSGLFLDILTASEIGLIPGRIGSLFLSGIGMKKRASWGTVYDSVTKAPLDPVHLQLRDASGTVVATTLTDIDGAYGFTAPLAGTYTIAVRKAGYTFPSSKFVGAPHDEVYRSLYHGESFTVAANTPIKFNIPVDQEGFDWTVFAETSGEAVKSVAVMQRTITGFVNFFFSLGFIASIAAFIMTPDIYNLAFLALSLFVFFVKKSSLFGHPFGYVRDIKTGIPLSFGLIRIISTTSGKPVTDVVLDASGRYAYPLPKGEYAVRIDQKLPDGSYKTLGGTLPAKVKKGYLAQDFLVTEQDPRSFLGFTTK